MKSLLPRLKRVVSEVGWAWLLTAFLAGWLFLELADDAPEGDYLRWEEPVIRFLRGDSQGDRVPFEQPSRAITELGGWPVLTAAGAASVAWLVIAGDRRRAVILLGVLLGGIIVSHTLKLGFNRERPAVVAPLVEVRSASFPSGHALNATIGYLTLAAVLSRSVRRRALRRLLFGLALGVSALVGLSRIHLGVHYPTDVLAGWALGLCLAPALGVIAAWFDAKPAQSAAAGWPDDFN